MRSTILVILLAVLAGCSSVPQKQALLDQVETDTKGADAEVLTFDSSNQVATVRYHHRLVYGKMEGAQYRFDGNRWEMVEDSSNQVLENIGTNAPNSQH